MGDENVRMPSGDFIIQPLLPPWIQQPERHAGRDRSVRMADDFDTVRRINALPIMTQCEYGDLGTASAE